MGKGVIPFFCIGVISMYTQTERLLLRSPSKEDKDDFSTLFQIGRRVLMMEDMNLI